MALTLTHRTKFQTTPGALTNTVSSSSFTPAAGSLLVLVVNDSGDASTSGGGTISVSDTFGDSGGGAWAQGAACIRTPVSGGQEHSHAEIWTRKIGTAPGAGTITPTGSWTPTSFNWLWCDPWEVNGQAASPIGLSSGSTNWQVAGPTTYTVTLGGTPATDSAVFLALFGDNTSSFGTQPFGFTVGDSDNPGGYGEINMSAYQNGSSPVASPQWTGLDAASDYLAAGLEIKAAAASFIAPPSPLVNQTVTTARYW